MKVTCKQCEGHVYAPWILRHESPDQIGPGRTVDYVLDAGVFCSATCLTKYLEPDLSDPHRSTAKAVANRILNQASPKGGR